MITSGRDLFIGLCPGYVPSPDSAAEGCSLFHGRRPDDFTPLRRCRFKHYQALLGHKDMLLLQGLHLIPNRLEYFLDRVYRELHAHYVRHRRVQQAFVADFLDEDAERDDEGAARLS